VTPPANTGGHSGGGGLDVVTLVALAGLIGVGIPRLRQRERPPA
jgi:hypothetical protein